MKIVLCEGKSDIAVITGLCIKAEIAIPRIEDYKGKDNLGNFLKEIVKRTEFVRNEVESLLVLRDADDDPDASWHHVRDAVQAGFKLQLVEPGEFVGKQPRLCALLIGGENGKGELEDLCLAAMAGDPSFPCLEAFTRCVLDQTKEAMRGPAKFRALMSTKKKGFELYVGKAVEEDLIPFHHTAFDGLRDVLRKL